MIAAAIDNIEMVRRLVGFDTTSRSSNLALIEFVRDYLDGLGVASELVFDETGNKANLYAKLGPDGIGGIMLSGHTDVVPVDGQDWHSDPFAVLAHDGRLYGRGTADMKSFLAVVLALLPRLAARPLRIPLHLAFSYDEEVGCRGARRLIAAIADRPDRPRLCIVGEPTLMQPVTGHKGKRSFRCRVRGFECHSALAHLGVNAIEAAAEMIALLKTMARQRRDPGPFDPEYTPALYDDPDRRRPRRHRAQHRAQGLRLRFRVPAVAGRGSRGRDRRVARLRREPAAARNARGPPGSGDRVRGVERLSRPRHRRTTPRSPGWSPP